MKAKSSRHKLNLTRTVKEYNESTSLHGLKYTTEYNRHSFERVFWMIVVVAFLTLGIFLTIRIVNKWQTSPIITTIESTNHPLSKVPFPAVTICPNYKGIKGKVATEVCNRKWLKDYSKVLYCGINVEKILKGSLDSISSPLVKIQIVGQKVCLRCKGKALLGVVSKLLKTKVY